MSRTVKIGVLALAVVAIAAVGTVLAAPVMALAQGPAQTPTPGAPYGPGGMMGGFGGMMGQGRGNGWMAEYRDEMHAAISEALGLSVEEFDEKLASGQTVWQIAEAQGVSVETLQAAKQAAHADILKQAVADGVLTQEQADWMLSHMTARGGWGMMGRGNGQRGGFAGNCPFANE